MTDRAIILKARANLIADMERVHARTIDLIMSGEADNEAPMRHHIALLTVDQEAVAAEMGVVIGGVKGRAQE